MSVAERIMEHMDALTLVLLLAALVAGVAVGWFLHGSRGAADLARIEAELAAARDDRDRQYDLYRDCLLYTSPSPRD